MHKRKKKEIIILSLIISPFILITIFVLILLYGNPQSNKLIYMAQVSGLWGAWECPRPKRPENYTGVWRDWYRDNASKFYEGEFINGSPVRKHTTWSDNGQVLSIDNYDTNGVRHGIQESYWPNGNKSDTSTYNHGILVGKAKYWDREGKLNFEIWYEDGERKIKRYSSTILKNKSIEIGTPPTERPYHTTTHTDRINGGSADQTVKNLEETVQSSE